MYETMVHYICILVSIHIRTKTSIFSYTIHFRKWTHIFPVLSLFAILIFHRTAAKGQIVSTARRLEWNVTVEPNWRRQHAFSVSSQPQTSADSGTIGSLLLRGLSYKLKVWCGSYVACVSGLGI